MAKQLIYGIQPDFLTFLALLEEKREGVPLAYHQGSIDFLDIIIGDGDCRRYALSGIIITGIGTDVLTKMYPKEGEDAFAGLQIWGGIQGFLSNYYRSLCGSAYAHYAREHNALERGFSAEEVFLLLLHSERCHKTPRYDIWGGRILRGLKEQPCSVHIPLLA